MVLRLAALFFAVVATLLFGVMSVIVLGPLPGVDPQTIVGGYGQKDISDFFAGLTAEERQAWRSGVIYLDFPFIVTSGLAACMIFAGAHGGLRFAGFLVTWLFVFCDALEDFQLLSQLEPFLAAGWVLYPPAENGALFLGWVTTAKIVSFFAMLLAAVLAIWQKPMP